MAQTTSDVLADRLIDWGVRVIFGLPGDGINGIIEALRTRKDKVKFIHVRHEESAAFMACGYAKFTGRLGVCLATSGPGGLHLLNGLYDAKLDGQPVLAMACSLFGRCACFERRQGADRRGAENGTPPEMCIPRARPATARSREPPGRTG